MIFCWESWENWSAVDQRGIKTWKWSNRSGLLMDDRKSVDVRCGAVTRWCHQMRLWRLRSPRICTWKNWIQTSISRASTSWCASVRSRPRVKIGSWVYQDSKGHGLGEWVKLPKVDKAPDLRTLCRGNSLSKWEFTENSVHVITGTQSVPWNREMLQPKTKNILKMMRVHGGSSNFQANKCPKFRPYLFLVDAVALLNFFHVFVHRWDTKAGQVGGMEECQLALWCLSSEVSVTTVEPSWTPSIFQGKNPWVSGCFRSFRTHVFPWSIWRQ